MLLEILNCAAFLAAYKAFINRPSMLTVSFIVMVAYGGWDDCKAGVAIWPGCALGSFDDLFTLSTCFSCLLGSPPSRALKSFSTDSAGRSG